MDGTGSLGRPMTTVIATELASVDGTISPTAEATVPLRDDGLYRGDGAFEVIRLYGGRPFALGDHLDRLERSGAAIELEFDRAALEGEIAALLAEAGEIDGQLRLIVTRGGRRIAATEPLPPHAETVRIATVTYSPVGDPQRRQVALLRGQHAGDPARQGAGRRRGGPGPARRHRARAADLVDLLGLAAGRPAHPGARRRRPRIDHPRPPGQGARRSRRAPGRSPTCAPPARPSSPRPRARSRRSRRSTAPSCPRRRGLAPARPRRPSRRLSAGSSNFDDEHERAGVRWTSS